MTKYEIGDRVYNNGMKATVEDIKIESSGHTHYILKSDTGATCMVYETNERLKPLKGDTVILKCKFNLMDKVYYNGDDYFVFDYDLNALDKYVYKLGTDEGQVMYVDVAETDLILAGDDEKLKETGGTKYDSGKPDLSFIEAALVEAAARALMFGAEKYGRNNYKKGIEDNRIYASLLRHIFARMNGEQFDPESGLDHIDHIAANVQFLAYFNKERNNG